jgi:hypothetical protein
MLTENASYCCSGIIHAQQYRHWRNTGIAFETGDASYEAPNRTLASVAEGTVSIIITNTRPLSALSFYGIPQSRGLPTKLRGYWGDVVVSPYHTVGTAAATASGAQSHASALVEPVLLQSGTEASKPSRSLAAGLFDIQGHHTPGMEQWRHNAGEVSLLYI